MIAEALKDAVRYDEYGNRIYRKKPTEPADTIRAVSLGELLRDHPELRRPVIHGVAREGEIINVIAGPKVGKSWLVYDLLLSVAAGVPWLARFTCERRRVLLIDNELAEPTIANRIPKVVDAKGMDLSDVAGFLEVVSLRGKLKDIFAIERFLATVEPGTYGLVVIDAFYRALPIDTDENANGDITALYNVAAGMAERLKCALVFIHHASKGNQSGKGVTDVGSGAGSQSRAADAHIVLRPHAVDGAVVMEAVVRSFAPVQPLCLRWEFPKFIPADDLDPSELKMPGPKRKRKEDTGDADPSETQIVWTPAKFAETFLNEEPKSKDQIVTAAEVVDISERKAFRWLNAAVDAGLAYRWEFAGKGKPVKFATIAQPVTRVTE
ncbi:AAA family ATPase [Humisphaera borealis]|uniref:AAA family ATPase n=1 Tax=Humisphaera borealis TaxID=2807512 RepID=A0A7M2WZZ8_9BACT|nr:AAA family ATPase [Humisphaera borealis]QOV91066.1 AAA family ATPase [Humisphaera borealis]